MEELNTTHGSTILKELSDIKASLAVNTSETANIKSTITEIKQDLRDIKAEAVTRTEFMESTKRSNDHESRIRNLEQFKWQLIGGLVAFQSIADYILYLVLHK